MEENRKWVKSYNLMFFRFFKILFYSAAYSKMMKFSRLIQITFHQLVSSMTVTGLQLADTTRRFSSTISTACSLSLPSRSMKLVEYYMLHVACKLQSLKFISFRALFVVFQIISRIRKFCYLRAGIRLLEFSNSTK